MRHRQVLELRFGGDFSLADSIGLAARASFVDPMRDGRLVIAFCVERSWKPVAIGLEQSDDRLSATVFDNPDEASDDEIRVQLGRMLSLDVDGTDFKDVAGRDQIVAALLKQRKGVRPILFPSPYEAAARAIIGHRLQVRQAAALRNRIASRHGTALNADCQNVHVFPRPAALASMSPVEGLSNLKVDQLRALGAAAADGWLDTVRLRAMDRDAAMSHLQKLAGIGPFSAELILLRGVGDADAFPLTEQRLHRAMTEAYGLENDPDPKTLEAISERWRPYRSWIGLLLRNRQADPD